MRFTARYETSNGPQQMPVEADNFAAASVEALKYETAAPEGLVQLVSLALTDYETKRTMPRLENGFRDTSKPYDRKWPSGQIDHSQS